MAHRGAFQPKRFRDDSTFALQGLPAGQLSISLTHSTLVLYCLAFLTAVAHDVRSNLLISIMLIKLTGRLIFKKWQLRLLVSIYFTHSNDDWY